jgi:hypothetical protein
VTKSEDPASWTDLIHESVHTSDDEDLGDIEAVSRNFVVVRKGLARVRRFYVPLTKVKGWDGRAVWLKVSEKEARENYEKDRRPDPHVYHFSSAQPTDTRTMVRNFQINMPKIDPTYDEDKPFVITHESLQEQHNRYGCDLCEEAFRSEGELDDHVIKEH